MYNPTLQFAVADDHPAFRSGIISFLQENFMGCSIIEADNGDELIQKIEYIHCDVIFMDIKMPGLNGIETAKTIITINPEAKIIALSFYEDNISIMAMFNNGAKAYLNKNAGKQEIINAVETVMNGGFYMNGNEMSSLLLKQLNGKLKKSSSNISEREKEILLLICEGLTNKEIALKLCLSVKTVENHRTHLLEKTSMHNTAGLVLYALKSGWV